MRENPQTNVRFHFSENEQHGSIYMIYNHTTMMAYVGRTTRRLTPRVANHVNKAKKERLKPWLLTDDVEVFILSNAPAVQLPWLEAQWISYLGTAQATKDGEPLGYNIANPFSEPVPDIPPPERLPMTRRSPHNYWR